MSCGLMFESYEGEGLLVCGCEPGVTEVVIPLIYGGEAVVGVAPYAFEGNTKIVSVRIDEAVDTAFEGARDIEAGGLMTQPFTVGERAFAGCTSLCSVELPSSVTEIGTSAFNGCPRLEYCRIPSCFIGEYAFYGCESLVEVAPLDYVPEGAFSHCKSLKSLPVSSRATEIGEDAFYHCYGLVDVVIPASVRTIGALAFRSCYGLRSVTFADPDGWVWRNGYPDREYPLDLSDPTKNAELLRTMDFDDGVLYWKRKGCR